MTDDVESGGGRVELLEKLDIPDWFKVEVQDEWIRYILTARPLRPTKVYPRPSRDLRFLHIYKFLVAKGYMDCPFELLKSWMEFSPSDVRCHKINGSRLSVRLDPRTTRILDQFTCERKITRSEAVHTAIATLVQTPAEHDV